MRYHSCGSEEYDGVLDTLPFEPPCRLEKLRYEPNDSRIRAVEEIKIVVCFHGRMYLFIDCSIYSII
jgi:hypothetical protein